jgi:hypothetical protein
MGDSRQRDRLAWRQGCNPAATGASPRWRRCGSTRHYAGVKKVLRQASDSTTAEQAERVLRNLARRLDHDAPGVSIHEGLDEMLAVIRLGLPGQLRRSLGCTNAIESLMAVLRQVCRNVKRWRDARMALRWTGTARQLATLRAHSVAN